MAYNFGPGPALNPNNPDELVSGASGEVYSDEACTIGPLTVTVGGAQVTTVQSGSNGIIQTFSHDTEPILYWKSGVIVIKIKAEESLVEEAQAAALSAQDASNSAAEIATRTMQLKGNAADGVSYWGEYATANLPTVGVEIGDWAVDLG